MFCLMMIFQLNSSVYENMNISVTLVTEKFIKIIPFCVFFGLSFNQMRSANALPLCILKVNITIKEFI